MSIARIFKCIGESLWAVGGIGASAELGLEAFGPQLARTATARGAEGRPEEVLEAEPCCKSCSPRSSR